MLHQLVSNESFSTVYVSDRSCDMVAGASIGMLAQAHSRVTSAGEGMLVQACYKVAGAVVGMLQGRVSFRRRQRGRLPPLDFFPPTWKLYYLLLMLISA